MPCQLGKDRRPEKSGFRRFGKSRLKSDSQHQNEHCDGDDLENKLVIEEPRNATEGATAVSASPPREDQGAGGKMAFAPILEQVEEQNAHFAGEKTVRIYAADERRILECFRQP